MRNKATTVPNVNNPSTDYPMGQIRNNNGTGNGTPIIEELYGDLLETITYFMQQAGIIPNNLPDNATNGYQIAEAIKQVAVKNNFFYSITQISSNPRSMLINSSEPNLERMQVGEVVEFQIGTNFNLYVDSGVTVSQGGNTYSVTSPGIPASQVNVPLFLGDFIKLRKSAVNAFQAFPVANIGNMSMHTREISMNVLHKGSLVTTVNTSNGLISITHPLLDNFDNKIIYVLTQEGASISPLNVGPGHMLWDRAQNFFRIAYKDFPYDIIPGTKMVIDWWIIND